MNRHTVNRHLNHVKNMIRRFMLAIRYLESLSREKFNNFPRIAG